MVSTNFLLLKKRVTDTEWNMGQWFLLSMPEGLSLSTLTELKQNLTNTEREKARENS